MSTASSNASTRKHKSILFVCLGNICRSPMAEAVFAHIVKERGLYEDWTVDSAAVIDFHVGRQPEKRTIDTLNNFGIKGFKHKARQVTTEDFRNFDYVMGMDDHNISDLREIQLLAGDGKAVLEMFGKYDPDGAQKVPDPYYDKGIASFEKVYHQLVRCCNAFLDK